MIPDEKISRDRIARAVVFPIPAMLLLVGLALPAAAQSPKARNAPGSQGERDAETPPRERSPVQPLHRSPGMGTPFRPRLSETERVELLAFMREHFPVMADELEEVRESRPQQHERRLVRFAPEMRRLMELMDTDPQRGELMIQERKLEMRVRQLSRRHRVAKDERVREELERDVRGLVEELFSVRVRRRELEIRAMEYRMDELKSKLSEMIHRREKIIDRQISEHLSDVAKTGVDGPEDHE